MQAAAWPPAKSTECHLPCPALPLPRLSLPFPSLPWPAPSRHDPATPMHARALRMPPARPHTGHTTPLLPPATTTTPLPLAVALSTQQARAMAHVLGCHARVRACARGCAPLHGLGENCVKTA